MELATLQERALDAARQITDPKDRSIEIASLAMLRSAGERAELIEEAVAAAEAIGDPKNRTQALTFAIVASTKKA